jgi:solute carrier family 25 (mitochondrial oxoglutarate transporter), member 11
MQLQGETQAPILKPAVQNLRLTLAFHATSLSAPSLLIVGVRLVQQEGVATLFSGISATILIQALYSTTRMGLYDILKKWTDSNFGNPWT